MSNENLAEHTDQFAFIDRLNRLEKELAELKKIQRIGALGLHVLQYPAYATPVQRTPTLAAGAVYNTTISYRYDGLSNYITQDMLFEPSVSIRVDVDDDDHIFGDPSGSLTSAQQKLQYSIVRNWEIGQTVQDPNNLMTYVLTLHNLDSSSHDYFIDILVMGPSGIGTLINQI